MLPSDSHGGGRWREKCQKWINTGKDPVTPTNHLSLSHHQTPPYLPPFYWRDWHLFLAAKWRVARDQEASYGEKIITFQHVHTPPPNTRWHFWNPFPFFCGYYKRKTPKRTHTSTNQYHSFTNSKYRLTETLKAILQLTKLRKQTKGAFPGWSQGNSQGWKTEHYQTVRKTAYAWASVHDCLILCLEWHRAMAEGKTIPTLFSTAPLRFREREMREREGAEIESESRERKRESVWKRVRGFARKRGERERRRERQSKSLLSETAFTYAFPRYHSVLPTTKHPGTVLEETSYYSVAVFPLIHLPLS